MSTQDTIVGEELAVAVARAAEDIKAEEIVVLDVRGLSSLTDFFVLCSGTSLPHLKAVRREVDRVLKEQHGAAPNGVEGDIQSQWMVLDYVDVMLHIFHPEKREVYALEDLWSDAPKIAWQSAPADTAGA